MQENKRTEREISVYTSECVCACACVCVRERDRGRVKKLRVEETDGRRVMSVCCVNEENSPKIKLENVYVRESCDCKKEKKRWVESRIENKKQISLDLQWLKKENKCKKGKKRKEKIKQTPYCCFFYLHWHRPQVNLAKRLGFFGRAEGNWLWRTPFCVAAVPVACASAVCWSLTFESWFFPAIIWRWLSAITFLAGAGMPCLATWRLVNV